MDVYHRVTFGSGNSVAAQIERIGAAPIKTAGFNGNYMLTLQIYESDPNWPVVSELIQAHRALDLYETVFSDEEVLKASWLRMTPTFEQGYPQPEKAWLRDRPNWEEWCYECGTFRQKSSYFLKKEPHLRKNSFYSLIWASTLFARHEVFDVLAAHKLRGYEKWAALIYKTKEPSSTVAQLLAAQLTRPGLTEVDDLPRSTCTSCGVTKYHPHKLGVMYFERSALDPALDVQESYEWFGDGHMAYREMIVSNRFARLALEQAWKGIRFKVIALR